MGRLTYGTSSFDIDDALLAHVEAATISKLRRSEAFALRVTETHTVWLSAASLLEFDYDGPRPELDRARLEALVESANTPAGMRLDVR